MIFTKYDAYTIDEEVEKLTGEINVQYRYCIGSFIYFLSSRVDLIFAVHKLAKFSSNPGKVHVEGLVHLLRYIRENKTLGLKYYANMRNDYLSDLLRQADNNTENQLMAFSGSSWKYFPNNGRSTGAYIIFYNGGPIDNGTHVTVPVDQ